LNQSALSLIGRTLGYRTDLPDNKRRTFLAKRKELFAAVEAGSINGELPPGVVVFVQTAITQRGPLDEMRRSVEREMVRLAESLPVWPLVKDWRGFGALGLAIIVGEAGDLNNYANPGKLWKRLGVAPKYCYAMITKRGKEVLAIPRARRSALFTVGDALIKQGSEYRALYLERKAYEHEQDPEMSDMYVHRRAQRYMEKRLLRNLWRAWRRAGRASDGCEEA
jgi:hypothetical protein